MMATTASRSAGGIRSHPCVISSSAALRAPDFAPLPLRLGRFPTDLGGCSNPVGVTGSLRTISHDAESLGNSERFSFLPGWIESRSCRVSPRDKRWVEKAASAVPCTASLHEQNRLSYLLRGRDARSFRHFFTTIRGWNHSPTVPRTAPSGMISISTYWPAYEEISALKSCRL